MTPDIQVYIDTEIEKLKLFLLSKIENVQINATIDIDKFQGYVDNSVKKELNKTVEQPEIVEEQPIEEVTPKVTPELIEESKTK